MQAPKALELFTVQNSTKLIYGKNTIPKIGDEIKAFKCQNVLMIMGQGSAKRTGVYQTVCDSLKAAGIKWVECEGVQPNPALTKVREAIKLAHEHKVDGILAIGGGSVIDTSKAVSVGVFVDDVWQVFEFFKDNTKGYPPKGTLPVFTVLTLSATGSEGNTGAVITNEAEQKKWLLFGDCPKVSIIDPTVQFTLPWSQVANGASDSMAHCMENYFTGRTQEMTMSINEAIQRTIIKSTDSIQKDKTDYDARANFCYATTLALNGTTGVGMDSGDWSVHFIEHALSAVKPDLAHGTGLAILYPAWILHLHKYNEETFKRWAKNVWGKNTVEEAVQALRAKYAQWHIPKTLKEVGIDRSSIPEIIRIIQMGHSTGVVKKLDADDLKAILEASA